MTKAGWGVWLKLHFLKWSDKEAKGIRCYTNLYLQERSQEKELMIKSKF
jgi:hypothetical protein